jgi:hypothetical protein
MIKLNHLIKEIFMPSSTDSKKLRFLSPLYYPDVYDHTQVDDMNVVKVDQSLYKTLEKRRKGISILKGAFALSSLMFLGYQHFISTPPLILTTVFLASSVLFLIANVKLLYSRGYFSRKKNEDLAPFPFASSEWGLKNNTPTPSSDSDSTVKEESRVEISFPSGKSADSIIDVHKDFTFFNNPVRSLCLVALAVSTILVSTVHANFAFFAITHFTMLAALTALVFFNREMDIAANEYVSSAAASAATPAKLFGAAVNHEDCGSNQRDDGLEGSFEQKPR